MKKIIIIIILQCTAVLCFSQSKVSQLLCNNLTNPIGIGSSQPQFSWQITSDKRDVIQTGFEIRVGESESFLQKGKKLEWNSGRISSDQSVHVDYKGSPLQSGKKYYWQVRVWDNYGNASKWSAPSFFQVGFLQTSDWKAKWIQPGFIDTVGEASPMFRKQFTAKKTIKSATVYITAHGLYEAKINGERVGDAYFTPGWTSYNKRLQYQVYDVTNLLKKGSNAIGVTLGSGWYRDHLAWGSNKNIYGKDISLLFQLAITYDDGTTETVLSDGSWKSATGSIIGSSIYDGETIDHRKAKTGWTLPGYDDSKWNDVKVADFSNDNLIATINEPAKKHETFKPVKVITTPKGEKVIDFGQNLVGWVMLKVRGNAGDTVTIQHAEVLDKEGNFYTTNLRAAKATSTLI